MVGKSYQMTGKNRAVVLSETLDRGKKTLKVCCGMRKYGKIFKERLDKKKWESQADEKSRV